MSTAIKQRLQDDVNAALKARHKPKVAALRLILAAVKQYEVDNRAQVTDEVALGLLAKLAKQRRESIEQFDAAGRDDLVAQERYELELITAYLPAQLSAEEIAQHIDAAISAAGAESMRDMGKVMGQLKAAIGGRADMGAVSAEVKARLSN